MFRGQISAGELFESLRPAVLLLKVFISAWLLYDAGRRQEGIYALALWTAGAFLFPFIFVPLYYAARIMGVGDHRNRVTSQPRRPVAKVKAGRIAFVYTATALSLAGLFFYTDYRSFDAHVARAASDKLLQEPVKAVQEYRAALSLRDDAHTHMLLGELLAGNGELGDAINEFRVAQSGGEKQDLLSYRLADALEMAHRDQEAALEYKKFLNSPICQDIPAEVACLDAEQKAKRSR